MTCRILLAVSCAALMMQVWAQPTVTVHEWGTFTCLQDDSGAEITGVNGVDEPVPPFVHRLPWELGAQPLTQGAPRCHPDVTMRLETPVTYFHMPQGLVGTVSLDVKAEFRGGLLTEYYPFAHGVTVDGTAPGTLSHEFRITPATTGALFWKGVKLGEMAEGPETDWPVWTAPRAVGAAATLMVERPGPSSTQPGDIGTTEGEVYLFYRGVGHVQSPVRIRKTQAMREVSVRQQQPTTAPLSISACWLLEVKSDGTAAYVHLGKVSGRDEVVTAPLVPPAQTFSADAIERLRSEMREALNAEGLFDDESAAMLNTWQKSYFAAPGLRLFYMVPRAWTDAVLPLSVDGPAEVKSRAMVGRIELISDTQREVLSAIPTDAFDMVAVGNTMGKLGRFALPLLIHHAKETQYKELLRRLGQEASATRH